MRAMQMRVSDRPPALQHDADRLDHDLEVEQRTPVAHVGGVQLDGVLEAEVAAPGDLPHAGDSGLDQQPGELDGS